MAKRKQPKSRKQIKRQTRHFQLRVEHPVDQHVAQILDFKRSKRSEVTAIRDGVRLLWALENGDLDVLFEMFPQYKTQLTSGGNGGVGGSDLAKEIAAQIILQGGTTGYLMQSAQPVAASEPVASKEAGLKGLKAPSFDLPVFEDNLDDAPTLVIKQAAYSGNASANFLSALNKLD